MLVRTAFAAAIIGLLGLSPALAQSVNPGQVLAAKSTAKTHGFADRTARLTSIMGPEMSGAAPMLHLPTKPSWKRTLRRDADAGAGMR